MTKEGSQEGACAWAKGSRNIWKSVTSVLVFDHCGYYAAISKKPPGTRRFLKAAFCLTSLTLLCLRKKRDLVLKGSIQQELVSLHPSPGYLPFSPDGQVLCFCSGAESARQILCSCCLSGCFPGLTQSLVWRGGSAGAPGGNRRAAPGVPAGESCGLPHPALSMLIKAKFIPAFRFMNMSIILEHCYSVRSPRTTTFITTGSPLCWSLGMFRIVAITGLRYTENYWMVDSAAGVEDWDRGQEQSRALDIHKLRRHQKYFFNFCSPKNIWDLCLCCALPATWTGSWSLPWDVLLFKKPSFWNPTIPVSPLLPDRCLFHYLSFSDRPPAELRVRAGAPSPPADRQVGGDVPWPQQVGQELNNSRNTAGELPGPCLCCSGPGPLSVSHPPSWGGCISQTA